MEEKSKEKLCAEQEATSSDMRPGASKIQRPWESKVRRREGSKVQQHEDAALKTCMQFFADELLPYLGIEGKVVSIAPTELVSLEIRKLYQDFNFIMDDGTWKHFEFQSTNEGVEGLRRFRAYEVVTSYQYKVEVTTYVLFSGNIKNPVTEFTEGINTYRVVPIVMKDRNADEMIIRLQKKLEAGENITKEEIIPLMLCPLMGGSMPQKERITAAYAITQKAAGIPGEEIRKIEAVIYAMADKFLESEEMEKLKEEISMTKLGQMLVDMGIEKGLAQGLEKGIRGMVLDYLEEGISEERICEKLCRRFDLSAEKAKEYFDKYSKEEECCAMK